MLCLLTDCLGSERPGFTPSEQVVGETIEKELSLCQGRFFFTTQSSNISRIQLAIEIALRYHRQITFLGRSVDQNTEEALKLRYMHFSREAVVRDRDLKRVPRTKQFLIVAGSQGQPESALARIANDNHRFVRVDEGDTVVFSADPIPGNEYNVNVLIEQLYRKGARVSYSDIMQDLHVSGHGSQGDLMLLLSALGPRYIMPIGGTYRHIMQYRRLAQDLGYRKQDVLIPEEGEILEFRKNAQPKVIQKVELENVMVDGLGVGDVGNVVLRDRQTIATEGIVVVVVPFERSSGRVVAQPDIISRGFIYMKESGDLIEKSRQVVNRALRLKKGRILEWQFARKLIEEDLSRFLSEETGRHPLIVPVVVEV
ncbi:ribonuclease J [Patescibacteria group bacterium]|nr:ribonuclease J [Patescibacteria group bacterium]